MIELLKRALVALENDKQFIADWGGYAPEYFQKKHDLEGDISAHDVLLREIKEELEKHDNEEGWLCKMEAADFGNMTVRLKMEEDFKVFAGQYKLVLIK